MPGVEGCNSKDQAGGLTNAVASPTQVPKMKAKIPNTWFIQVKNKAPICLTMWPKLHGQALMLV